MCTIRTTVHCVCTDEDAGTDRLEGDHTTVERDPTLLDDFDPDGEHT